MRKNCVLDFELVDLIIHFFGFCFFLHIYEDVKLLFEDLNEEYSTTLTLEISESVFHSSCNCYKLILEYSNKILEFNLSLNLKYIYITKKQHLIVDVDRHDQTLSVSVFIFLFLDRLIGFI